MIRTILVDDETRLLESLKHTVARYCPQLEVVAACNDPDEAIQEIKDKDPDLVIMDISMPRKNAFDLLNELYPVSFHIIFVTAHHEYSLQAFKYSAVDYLLKPLDETELIAAVTKAEKKIKEKSSGDSFRALLHNLNPHTGTHQKKICLTTLTGFRVISASEIVYGAAEGSYTNFILTDKTKICVSKPIIEFEHMLDENEFLRVHKSFIVNLQHIKEYKRGDGGILIMDNNDEIDVSRRKKDIFLEKAKKVFKF